MECPAQELNSFVCLNPLVPVQTPFEILSYFAAGNKTVLY